MHFVVFLYILVANLMHYLTYSWSLLWLIILPFISVVILQLHCALLRVMKWIQQLKLLFATLYALLTFNHFKECSRKHSDWYSDWLLFLILMPILVVVCSNKPFNTSRLCQTSNSILCIDLQTANYQRSLVSIMLTICLQLDLTSIPKIWANCGN